MGIQPVRPGIILVQLPIDVGDREGTVYIYLCCVVMVVIQLCQNAVWARIVTQTTVRGGGACGVCL